MILQIALQDITAKKISDNPLDPLDRKGEIYQTYHMRHVQVLEESGKDSWLLQGFSSKVPLNGGLSLKDGETAANVMDPLIQIKLDTSIVHGTTLNYELEMHHWESDRSTEKVKSVFTNDSLNSLLEAHKNSNKGEKNAEKVLNDWLLHGNNNLFNSGRKILSLLNVAAGPVLPWIKVTEELLPVLKMAVLILKNNSDDYISLDNLMYEFRNNNDKFEWRFNSPQSSNPWTSDEDVQYVTSCIRSADNRTLLDLKYMCRVRN